MFIFRIANEGIFEGNVIFLLNKYLIAFSFNFMKQKVFH